MSASEEGDGEVVEGKGLIGTLDWQGEIPDNDIAKQRDLRNPSKTTWDCVKVYLLECAEQQA